MVERISADRVQSRAKLENVLGGIWRRKWIVILFIAATVGAVILGNSLRTPIFEASAVIHVKSQVPSVLGDTLFSTEVGNPTALEDINTQIEILKSRSVLEEALRKLDLVDTMAPERRLPESEKLEFAIEALKKQLSVSSLPNTRLIKISIHSEDPERAMRIANAITQTLIVRNVESKRSEANAVLAFVLDQVTLVGEKLDRAEEDLLRYKQTQRVTDLTEESRLKLDRLSDLESSLQQVVLDRQILGVRISTAQKLGSIDGALESASSGPNVKALQDQLSGLESQLALLDPNDTKAVDLKDRIESLRKDIKAELEKALGTGRATSVNSVVQLQMAEYKSQDIILAAQEDALRGLINANEAEVNRLSAKEISLARLERTRTINEDLYSVLVKTKNQAQIEAISQLGNIDVIDPAVTPLSPVSPKKKENLIIGFFLSLFLGICFAIFLEYFDTNVKTEEEIKKLVGIPILGFIPKLPQNGRRAAKKSGVPQRALSLLMRDEPKSSFSEAFRLLRTNLSFIELDKGLKTIIVTSAVPGEGKTTIAANLAVALASQEERVLIMDMDFRAPALHKILQLPHSPGFTNILTDHMNPQSLIRQVTGVPNLRAIMSGPIPPNPAEIVGSSRMRQLIEELREGFDRVILDVPPVLGATDAMMISSYLDGTLIVFRMGRIDRRAVVRMTEILANTKVNILGGVLNGVKNDDRRYSYGYYWAEQDLHH
jgi:capsular exopolysaccharide synthesis family protein